MTDAMLTYHVAGVNQQSGQSMVMLVAAVSEADAARQATGRGLDVQSVRQVTTGELAPQLPGYAADSALRRFIPYRNAWALAAYYVGVFSLIAALLPVVGILVGIVPIGLGIAALTYSRSNPEAHGAAHAWAGIGLGVVCILGNILVMWLMANYF